MFWDQIWSKIHSYLILKLWRFWGQRFGMWEIQMVAMLRSLRKTSNLMASLRVLRCIELIQVDWLICFNQVLLPQKDDIWEWEHLKHDLPTTQCLAAHHRWGLSVCFFFREGSCIGWALALFGVQDYVLSNDHSLLSTSTTYMIHVWYVYHAIIPTFW